MTKYLSNKGIKQRYKQDRDINITHLVNWNNTEVETSDNDNLLSNEAKTNKWKLLFLN